MSGDDKERMKREVRRSFYHGLRVGSFVAFHAALAIVFSVAICVTHFAFILLGDPKMFDRFPIRYIFEAGEIGIVLIFVIGGLSDGTKTFKDHDHD